MDLEYPQILILIDGETDPSTIFSFSLLHSSLLLFLFFSCSVCHLINDWKMKKGKWQIKSISVGKV